MVARFAGDGGGLLEPPYPRMTQIPDMTIKFSSIILWDIYSQYVKKKVEQNFWELHSSNEKFGQKREIFILQRFYTYKINACADFESA